MKQQPQASPLRIPPGVVALADYEAAARERLDAATWAYVQGGAGDELTCRANREAWDALPLHPRVLRPLAGDCCVFCSFGDVPCPPIQEAKANGTVAGCCG